VRELQDVLANDYPLFRQRPWRFVKVENRLCGGFSHTRGPCIIFSQRTVDRIVRARDESPPKQALRRMGPLFVHEQMHVLERYFPERFSKLFTEVFGFEHASVEEHAWLRERQICNPDAPRHEWVIAARDENGTPRPYWFRTLLNADKPVPRMGRDFLMIAVQLESVGSGHYRVSLNEGGQPRYRPLDQLDDLKQRFHGIRGLDHPNEIAAYLFEEILERDYLWESTSQTQEGDIPPLLPTFRKWCQNNLR